VGSGFLGAVRCKRDASTCESRADFARSQHGGGWTSAGDAPIAPGRSPGETPLLMGLRRFWWLGLLLGYGLAARITAAFGCGADTPGVCFEHSGSATKPGSAGWYNTAAFERLATDRGRYAKDIIGDAFSDAVKERAIEVIKRDLGKVDLVVYSRAAPRRTHPRTGAVFASTLNPVGKSVALRTIDTDKEVVKEVVLPPATQAEIDQTVAVMGWRGHEEPGTHEGCIQQVYRL